MYILMLNIIVSCSTAPLSKYSIKKQLNFIIKEKINIHFFFSQARKLESAGVIKEEQYKELCRLVIEIFTKEGREIQYEAIEALDAILQEFRAHSLHVFESLLQTNKKTRFV